MENKHLTNLSLFSGLGAEVLVCEWAGIKTIAFCEIDPFCQSVLKLHWPGVPIIPDIKDVTYEKIKFIANAYRKRQQQPEGGKPQKRGRFVNCSSEIATHSTSVRRPGRPKWQREEPPQERRLSKSQPGNPLVDIVSGGFPCQGHSVAGCRQGASDSRNLWPEMRRVIGETKPHWCVVENVPGLRSSDAGQFFGGILRDLAALGYNVGWGSWGACDLGAPHRRERVFVVGHSEHYGFIATEITKSIAERSNTGKAGENKPSESTGSNIECRPMANLCNPADPRLPDWAGGKMGMPHPLAYPKSRRVLIESFCDVDARTPPNLVRLTRSERINRLKALGNTNPPIQYYPIYKAIAEIEGQTNLQGNHGEQA